MKSLKRGNKRHYYLYEVKAICDKEKKQSRQKVLMYIGKAEDLKPVEIKSVLKRDNYTCQKCGSIENLTIDHIKPLFKGGNNDLENLQTLCLECNQKKRDLEDDISTR